MQGNNLEQVPGP